ncbi:MAG: hypothetical protein PWP08_103 [Methanofollis sp.]|nr:hypothetical protein [Methanofollis sp.]
MKGHFGEQSERFRTNETLTATIPLIATGPMQKKVRAPGPPP